MKAIYQSPTEELALEKLDEFDEKWGKKYASSIASWRNNWAQLSTFFKCPEPTDDALFKSIYLAMMDITKKWSGKAWNWGQTLDQLMIYFGDRISPEDLE